MTDQRISKMVFPGSNNVFILRLGNAPPDDTGWEGDDELVAPIAPANLSSVDKMELDIGGELLSVDWGMLDAPINWWDNSLEQGAVRFMLGGWAESVGLPVGLYTGELQTFDPLHPDGVYWTTHDQRQLQLTVVQV